MVLRAQLGSHEAFSGLAARYDARHRLDGPAKTGFGDSVLFPKFADEIMIYWRGAGSSAEGGRRK